MDAAWQLIAERLKEAGQDAKLSFEVQPKGRLKLNMDHLGALGEPKSLRWLRKTTAAVLPKIDLPASFAAFVSFFATIRPVKVTALFASTYSPVPVVPSAPATFVSFGVQEVMRVLP